MTRFMRRSVLLLLLAVALGACTRSVVDASCSPDAGSGYMSCRSLLQAPNGAQDEVMTINNSTISVAVPVEIAVPAGSILLGAFRAVGQQHYSFNGTGWVLHNATAWLYEAGQANTSQAQLPLDMGREAVVGVHFYLGLPDADGGQPSWRLGTSRVTAKGLAASTVDSNSITWNLLQATTYQLIVSESPTEDYTWLGQVSFVQRLDTQRGLPPPASTAASVGDTFSSVYSALYAFYAGLVM